MKYFKDDDNQVYAYEDDFDDINLGLFSITEKEAMDIANPPPTKDEFIAIAKAEKAKRQAEAQIAIAPLQDAVDIEEATDEETVLMKKWKQYSVAVNRIDTSTAPDISWPTPPAN